MKNSTKPSLGSNNKIKELDPCKDNEELFRNTFEQAAVGLAHVGVDGNFIRINQKFCDIVGYSTEEMLTRTFQDITHPDDIDADLEHEGSIIDVNHQTCYSLGFSPEELLAMNISEMDVSGFLFSDENIKSFSMQNGFKKEINAGG